MRFDGDTLSSSLPPPYAVPRPRLPPGMPSPTAAAAAARPTAAGGGGRGGLLGVEVDTLEPNWDWIPAQQCGWQWRGQAAQGRPAGVPSRLACRAGQRGVAGWHAWHGWPACSPAAGWHACMDSHQRGGTAQRGKGTHMTRRPRAPRARAAARSCGNRRAGASPAGARSGQRQEIR